MAGAMTTSFQTRFNELQSVENEKDQLIKDLIAEYDRVAKELEMTGLDLDRERFTNMSYQKNDRRLKAEVKKAESDMNSNPFVCVLIDGDCMNVRTPESTSTVDGLLYLMGSPLPY
jgi:hypothetical protein